MRPLRRSLAVITGTVAATVVLAVPAQATWSVIGTDPATGEVGVAVASCVPGEVVAVPVIVPGVGAGASQAMLNSDSGAPMAAALKSGASAEDVVAAVTAPEFDPQAAARQFGVVTLAGTAAGFTGSANEAVAGDAQNAAKTASVQGNILVSDAVVANALSAFDATSGPLADRLLAGLQAGSAAGGDSRCGARTASAAALIVAKPGDAEWVATDQLLSAKLDGKQTPSTYVSVVPSGTANPVDVLTSQYRAAAAAANGGPVQVRQVPWLVDTFGLPPLLVYIGLGLLLVLVLVGVLIIWLIVRSSRKRRRRAAA
jgi:uncharacterized Ntn-hydrolase superfamily protein